jgi:hypothetical protein
MKQLERLRVAARFGVVAALWLALQGLAAPVHAQDDEGDGSGDAAPSRGAAPANASYLRPCIQDDIYGIWKLINVSEQPAGPQLDTFQHSPHQYIYFDKSTKFNEEMGTTAYEDSGPLIDRFERNASRALQQFVMTDTGAIYIYKNQVATQMLTCTFVTGAHDFYQKGDLILGYTGQGYQYWKLYRKSNFSRNTAPKADGAKAGKHPRNQANPNKRPRKGGKGGKGGKGKKARQQQQQNTY